MSDHLLMNIQQMGLFKQAWYSKLIAIGMMIVSLVGATGKKEEKMQPRVIGIYLFTGSILFFGSAILFHLKCTTENTAILYMAVTTTGYLLLLAGGTYISRFIRLKLSGDIFNELNESFPQEERLLQNPYSINLPSRYQLKGKERSGWINIINPFRGTLVVGSPGSGKSWFVIQHIIKQHIEKGFSMFIYDFKYDDLSRIAYNWLQLYSKGYKIKPAFYVISFDHLERSHRCNPITPEFMHDITDASESARSILLGLNREWIKKQGDFFVESPVNFLTAIIWFLRCYKKGKYCTIPHAIELMQADYEELFPVLNTIPECETLVNPFVSAYQNDAMEQLEGQVASTKITLSRLASPQLYWILSGNDFTLDINNPEAPKIVCMGNNPEKQVIYGAVLSLFISRMIRMINKKDKLPCSLVFDEFPTIFFNHMDSVIATARSSKVATTLAMQDFSQLKKDYGRDQAEVIMNITGNIISGQVSGETAKQLSERFGKIMQDRESISITRTDTNINKSKQLDQAIPSSKITSLSSGEFVGMVADNPDEKIKLKMFHSEIINDTKQLAIEQDRFVNIPVNRKIATQEIMDNYSQIKLDIFNLLESEIGRLKAEKGL